MACANCSGNCGSKKNIAGGSAPMGCQSNGTCGTSGCNKLNVFDWLGNMELPRNQQFDIVEIRFKGNRKEFFRLPPELDICTGDAVIVEVPNGFHLGFVSLQGELVRLQLNKRRVKDDENILMVVRLATQRDWDKFEEAQNKETPTLYRTRQIIEEMKLSMKLSDIEYQMDGTKATFFYSADARVDFRELIRILAAEFKIRVEMRQISLRQEAGRLGGIGSCGRELCCSTWLTEFKSVSTVAARYQNLSLNPTKLSGQCGRLKCCLNYELQTYLDALVDIPKIERPLQTEKGEATLQKTDIFRKIMWFSYVDESNWFPVPTAQVREILELNAKGVKVPSLSELETEKTNKKAKKDDFRNDLSLESDSQLLKKDKQKQGNRNKRTQKRGRKPEQKPDPKKTA